MVIRTIDWVRDTLCSLIVDPPPSGKSGSQETSAQAPHLAQFDASRFLNAGIKTPKHGGFECKHDLSYQVANSTTSSNWFSSRPPFHSFSCKRRLHSDALPVLHFLL
jgi:hypothetical protein